MTLLLACSFFLTLPAQAIDYRGVGGRPAYPRADNPRTDSIFVHTIEPGDEINDGIRVINNDKETKTLLVYAADSTPSSSGGFACKQLLDTQTKVGTWIEMEKTEVTLEPGRNEVIDFVIRAPETADVGEHNGCILVQEKPADEVDEDRPAGMHLSFRSGLRVALTVPGELKRELALTQFEVQTRPSQPGFLYIAQVENTGNVSTDTDVIVKTTNIFGKQVAEHGGRYAVLRDDVSKLNFEVDKPYWGGWYKAQLSVEYDADASLQIGTSSGERITIEGEPVWYFSMPNTQGLLVQLGVLAIIIVVIILIFVSIKRKHWIQRNWVAYEAKEEDDIKSLAEKYNVSWKVLAKANKLSAPYTIHKAQDLIVPPTEVVEEETEKPKKNIKPKKESKKKPSQKKEVKSKKDSDKS